MPDRVGSPNRHRVLGHPGALGSIARSAIPLAAILMPAGFFFSSARAGRTKPSALIWLLYFGTVSHAAGVGSLGIGLLTA
jgi:hypothetical protein